MTHLPPLIIDNLTAATLPQRKQMLVVCLHPRVAAHNNSLATKITGMLLELDDTDVLHLLDTPDALTERVQEAERVLREHAESIEKEQILAESVNGNAAGVQAAQNGGISVSDVLTSMGTVDDTAQNANCASDLNNTNCG